MTTIKSTFTYSKVVTLMEGTRDVTYDASMSFEFPWTGPYAEEEIFRENLQSTINIVDETIEAKIVAAQSKSTVVDIGEALAREAVGYADQEDNTP